MSQLKPRRKRGAGAGPNLRLVPPPKRKRRSRWKLPRNLRQIRKPKYGSNPTLLRYEEDIVYAAMVEMGGSASVEELEWQYPERFRRRLLWRTLNRLAEQERLHLADKRPGTPRWFRDGTRPKLRFHCRPPREENT